MLSAHATAAAMTAILLAAPAAVHLVAARQPASAAAAACPTWSDAAGRQAADAYLRSLTTHDPGAIPFARDAVRVENGLVTGGSADELRGDLRTSVKYSIITGLRNRVYAIAPGVVRVHYLLDVGAPALRLATVAVDERFVLACGRIEFIEADVSPS